MKKLILALLLLGTLPVQAYDFSGDSFYTHTRDITYSRHGNSIYGSDGSSYNSFGNSTYGTDGTSYHRNGNTRYSGIVTYTRQGNITFGSDGSSCASFGSNAYCN